MVWCRCHSEAIWHTKCLELPHKESVNFSLQTSIRNLWINHSMHQIIPRYKKAPPIAKSDWRTRAKLQRGGVAPVMQKICVTLRSCSTAPKELALQLDQIIPIPATSSKGISLITFISRCCSALGSRHIDFMGPEIIPNLALAIQAQDLHCHGNLLIMPNKRHSIHSMSSKHDFCNTSIQAIQFNVFKIGLMAYFAYVSIPWRYVICP